MPNAFLGLDTYMAIWCSFGVMKENRLNQFMFIYARENQLVRKYDCKVIEST